MENLDPRDGGSLDHRGLIGRIYVGDHKTLLHTKYISSKPHGFREEDFLSCFDCKSIETLDPRDGGSLDPRGLIGRIYLGEY